MISVPSTTERVSRHTSGRVNAEVREEARRRVMSLANGSRDDISRRLDELDREWDIERVLEANAATLTLMGVVLAAATDKRFLILPGLVSAFLLQHAVQGWCPPVPLFRRLGFRTSAEIDEERFALKALRGDFRDLCALTPADERAEVARFEGEGGGASGPGEEDVYDRNDRAAVEAALSATRR